ncbi:MAG: sugar transferase [Clostridia bacterium]|nr:sugar transferase [Clostridia bacterium]
MILKKLDNLPLQFRTDAAFTYYERLSKRKVSLAVKRVFDLVVSLIAFLFLLPFYLIIGVMIKLDSPGKVFYKQERVTSYGKIFKIYKFRTMVENADKIGSLVTVNGDARITRVGRVLRKYRLDETPQLINIIKGDMSFVGTRPEVQKYVDAYTDEMYATLLLPAGVTSLASIYYKDEERLLSETGDTDYTYINEILPEKMRYNLEYINKFSFFYDIKLMIMTVLAVCGVEFKEEIHTLETLEEKQNV